MNTLFAMKIFIFNIGCMKTRYTNAYKILSVYSNRCIVIRMYTGLFGLSHSHSDHDVKIVPFPPGHVEVYDLDKSGKAWYNTTIPFNRPGQPPIYDTLAVAVSEYSVLTFVSYIIKLKHVATYYE